MRTFPLLLVALAIAFVAATAAAIPLTNTELRTQVAAYKSDPKGAQAAYGPIANWDTSEVTDMSSLFSYSWDDDNRSFNGKIGGWDTSNVVTMRAMLLHASAFNQHIGEWDTSKVTDMSSMFYNAQSFNKDIGGWDTSKVTTMFAMFNRAKTFNQDIGGWDVSSVTTMKMMFDNNGAKATLVFNKDISGWCTSKVTDMSNMLRGAPKFSYTLPWDISSITDKDDMMQGGILTDTNCRNCHSDCPDLSCTAAQEKLGWTKHASLGICAGSYKADGSCLSKKSTFTSALEECDAIGARLCTRAELYENKAGIGTGCGGDKKWVWTSQMCRNGSRRLAINVKSRKTSCSKLSSKRAVRCCADLEEGTVIAPRRLRGDRS